MALFEYGAKLRELLILISLYKKLFCYEGEGKGNIQKQFQGTLCYNKTAKNKHIILTSTLLRDTI